MPNFEDTVEKNIIYYYIYIYIYIYTYAYANVFIFSEYILTSLNKKAIAFYLFSEIFLNQVYFLTHLLIGFFTKLC